MADPFAEFVVEQLEKYPRLCAGRLFEMVKARGYPGGADHFRRVVGRHRPRKPAEAFQRLKTLPGEQAQVDWAHFGKMQIGRAERVLWAFVMVLSFSRQVFLRFFLGSSRHYFLRGHVDAFAFFGGAPRVLLYDNLKSAVLERRGDIVRFNPKVQEIAAHYHCEASPVAVARGNEKGRVERAIRYIRDDSSLDPFAMPLNVRANITMDSLLRLAQVFIPISWYAIMAKGGRARACFLTAGSSFFCS